ncbi:hypothetical protein TNIN_361031 [Trichonephila inaurata madagascariensis]|uniref:Uncharacterized protein n=1 Tax=Trichonephila inaurata madagascariensis TaxID=2747483 RepID=A0A8X6YAT1_9ARAC|nr:hypothetical protein TNIN_361031 [Trichonephila inaurata madagascariensis]
MPRRTPIPCSNGTLGIQVSDRTDDLRQDLGVIRLGVIREIGNWCWDSLEILLWPTLASCWLVLVSVLDWGSEVKCNFDVLNRFRYLSCSYLCIAWDMEIGLTSIVSFNMKYYLEVVVCKK